MRGTEGVPRIFRVPLEVLGVHVHPDMFSLAQAHQAFDDAGGLRDAALAKRLTELQDAFVA